MTLVLLLLLARTLFSITSLQAGWTALHSFDGLITPLDDRPARGEKIWGSKYHPVSRINTHKSQETDFKNASLWQEGGGFDIQLSKPRCRRGSEGVCRKASASWQRKQDMLCLWLVLLVWKAVTPCASPALQELGWECNLL